MVLLPFQLHKSQEAARAYLLLETEQAVAGGGGHAMTSSPPKPTSDTLIKTKTQLFIRVV